MEKTVIRTILEEDLLDVLILAKEFSREAPKSHKWSPEKTKNFLISAMHNTNMEVFISEKQGEVTGAIVCLVTEMYMSNTVIASDVAWFVNKDARGDSSAIRLLKAFEAWGRSKGADYLGMADIEGLSNLSSLYSRMGYSVFETTYMKEA